MAVGVFGLQDAYKLKRTELLSLEDTHGWFGGDSAGPATLDRIDFSNDTGTASVRGSLSAIRYQLAATGNSNYGWFGGGQFFVSPTNVLKSTVERIDFSNDSTTASPRGPLSLARSQLAATGNSNYGWFGGGGDSLVRSTVDRIDFSNDAATSSVRGPLSAIRYKLAATGNSNYGWFSGGYNPALAPAALRIVSAVDRIDFSNDSATASPRGPLSLARERLAATGNSNYGWFGGGSPAGSRVDRIDFSNDSIAASARGNLSLTRQNLTATGNSNYGWFGGGYLSGVGFVSSVERIDFSNDSSAASPRGPLYGIRQHSGATSGQAKSSSIRLQKTGNYGWFGGGQNPAASPTTLLTVDRIDFSNDAATSSLRGSLSLARNNLAATGNSNYGWFGGGLNPAASPTTVSRVDRIDFSNDSVTASLRGSLSFARSSLAATGNSNYGWFGGGFSQDSFSTVNTIDRINFSNDSVTASPRSFLSTPTRGLSATGNTNYGWFSGGFPNSSLTLVNRINFSNDTTSARGQLSAARAYLAATSNTPIG